MLFNDRLDAVVALAFMAVAVLVIVVSMREWLLVIRHRKPAVLREGPFVLSGLGVAAILADVGAHFGMDRGEPLNELFS